MGFFFFFFFYGPFGVPELKCTYLLTYNWPDPCSINLVIRGKIRGAPISRISLKSIVGRESFD